MADLKELLARTYTRDYQDVVAAWTAMVTAVYGLGLVRFDPAAALPFSFGVCAGITLWFALLLGLVKRFRTRISDAVLGRVRRGVGLILVLLGLGLAVRVAWCARLVIGAANASRLCP